jgi:hypothetical protein
MNTSPDSAATPEAGDAYASQQATLDMLARANALDNDRVIRWQPSAEQLRWARALFATEPGLGRVFVALAHPGKTSGCWMLDTKVEHVPGLWPVSQGREHDNAYRAARNEAWYAAQRWLGDRKGTTSYVVIDRDGNTPAFEG